MLPEAVGALSPPLLPIQCPPGDLPAVPGAFQGAERALYRSSPGFSSQAAFRSRAYSTSGPSPRFSSRAAFRNRAYFASGSSPRHSSQAAFRKRVSSSPRQLVASRTTALRPQGFNNNRVIARQSANWRPNWDKRRDHFWRGHRCRWSNNSWVIFGLGFYPWSYGYGYYPYGAYSYYDGDYYDDGYASSEYSQEPSQSEYDSGNPDSSVSQVQAALAREGYYHGAIDGSLGPATRNALRRYQRNQGLDVTGRIDRPVIEALGLR